GLTLDMSLLVPAVQDSVKETIQAKMDDLTVCLNRSVRSHVVETMADAAAMYWPTPPPSTHDDRLVAVSSIDVHPSRRKALRNFLNDHRAVFTHPMQGVLVEHIVRGKENILAVMATGSGKTTTIMMIAKMYAPQQTLVVILPLLSLHADMHARALQCGLVVSQFDAFKPFHRDANIVTVAVESLESKALHKYLREKASAGTLYRIVFDEIHKVLTDGSYRSAFMSTMQLNLFMVPIIGLTATLPTTLVPALSADTHIVWNVLRMSSNRKELQYSINRSPDPTQSLVDHVNAVLPTYGRKDRGLIYCRSRVEADRLAAALGVSAYHAQTDEQPIADFIAGKYLIMPCTTALGVGFDYAHVRDVLHLQLPYTLLDKYQQDGRGGRDGSPCRAVTFIQTHSHASRHETEHDLGESALHDWIECDDQCLRIIPSRFMDGVPITCSLMDNAEMCASCVNQAGLSPPDQPRRLTTVPALTVNRARTSGVPAPPTLTKSAPVQAIVCFIVRLLSSRCFAGPCPPKVISVQAIVCSLVRILICFIVYVSVAFRMLFRATPSVHSPVTGPL
ncbi:hypothetical protein EUX98_g8528, partial [Antrodiella citrinella]